jgi:peptidyl-prolyl cis-trans isomerase SurA
MIKNSFIVCLMLVSVQSLFGQKVIDKVVAQVGDNIILFSEIEQQKQAIKQSGATVGPDSECALLEQMMYNFLLVNQAELDSIQISDEQVDAEMENRLRSIEAQMKDVKDEKGNPITIESFYGKSKSQIKEEFRSTIKKRLQGQEVERGITSHVAVSPKEVEQFYAQIPKDSLPLINSQLGFQQIAIFPTITKADKERAFQELSDIRKQIVEGKRSFQTMARLYSDDPGSAAEGGKIEATRGMMVRPFEATAYTLKPGEISEVFETDFGYHIMLMGERKGDDYLVYHILKSIEFSPDSLDAAAKRMDECYTALRNNSITWEEAVKKYSNDPNTKENKGYITNPITGEQKWSIDDVNQVDPQMFMLTDALQTGEVTAPGFYFDFNERKKALRIVRISERTQPHVANLKDDYNLFRNLAEEDKRNKAILAWTKSRISTAYIRIDDSFKSCVFQNVWLP